MQITTPPPAAPAPAATRAAAAPADHELAARAAAGDDLAFELIMRRHNRLLFRTARSVLRSDAEAEEALQEAYLRAWRALGTFRAEARLSTWLARIVINEALGRLRRRSVSQTPLETATDGDSTPAHERIEDPDPDHQPEPVAMRAQTRRLIEARIDRLPEAFRSVFMLRAVEELSVEETAAALQIPEATVRTRYFRARSQLREALARDVDAAFGDAFSFDGQRCERLVRGVLTRLAAERNFRA